VDYIIADIPKDQIIKIKHLWENLNAIHLMDSVYFKDYYKSFSFEKRIESFMQEKDENIKISAITKENAIYGYCISTIHDTKGEIESSYISEEIQKKGYGKRLVKLHTEWMKQNNCEKIVVAVSYGHNSVLDFYHKVGFYERLIELEYKE